MNLEPRLKRCLLTLSLAAFTHLPVLAQAAATKARSAEPIRVGAISTLSGGPAEFAPVGQATRAFFDSVNAAGGIQGRKLVLIQEDDRAEPQAAAQAAAKLLNVDKVVANVGGASLLECAVNAAAYEAAGMVSIPGLGLDASCFRSRMIAPVNAGPYTQLTVAMRFAVERLKAAERLCVFRMGVPVPVQKAFDAEMKAWLQREVKAPVIDEGQVQYGDDPLRHVQRAVDAKCQALVFAGPAPVAIGFAKAAKKVVGKAPPLLFLGAAYTEQVGRALGPDAEGIYAISEFEPWSSRSGSLSNWRDLMMRSKLPVTSSSQGGYVAAQVFVHVLRGIKGEITRESVTQAFRALDRYEPAMVGMPFVFGPAAAHHPNRAAIPVQMLHGHWRIAHHEWITAD